VGAAVIGAVGWGVAATPLVGEVVCGDLHVVWPRPQGVLVGLIDGLGHGAEAADAARAAARVLQDHAADPLDRALRQVHEAIRRTRGVVLTVAALDVPSSTITWAAVGNVEAQLLRADPTAARAREAVPQRGGVVGSNLPPVRLATMPLSVGDTLVLHTDGLRRGLDTTPAFAQDPQWAAERLLADGAHGRDDACVLVVRWHGGPAPSVVVPVHDPSDVVMARKHARDIGSEAGLSPVAAAEFATAVTEIATNLLAHARSGDVAILVREADRRRGVTAIACDAGPGIPAPEQALRDGWSSRESLGLGLPGARRLVDLLDIASLPGRGTTITLTKWARGGGA
jgi:anti-sigma regulatory factor (Ser/Thr protein kinase)